MRAIKVQQYKLNGEFIKEYDSIADAAVSVSVDESSIRRALDNTTRTVKSFKWTTTASHLVVEKSTSRIKILMLDVETAPLMGYIWGLWKQNIPIDAIVSDWFILTWVAKWVGDDIVHSERLTSEEALAQDDKRIMESLWSLLDEADIVVAHYGDKFDIPRVKSRFLIHGMMPPSPYKQIDTKSVASKEFGFSSNKLEALARLLGHGGKIKTSLELWINCMKGDENALKEMEEYNIQDVYVLEDVYISLRPYIKGHPNLDLYSDTVKPTCPACSSPSLYEVKGKYFYTQAVRYPLYRCEECGSLSRAKKGEKYENAKQISAIPR